MLLTPCEDADDAGVLAYASSQATEAAFGAAFLLLQPSLTHYGRTGRTGFDRTTYIYPSRLVGASTEEMQRRVGRIVRELADLRHQLRKALGIGSDPRTTPRGWRGQIVRFSEAVRSQIDVAYGLIVTEPSYSSKERYQLVVPILDLQDYEQSELDVVVEGKAWLHALFGDPTPVALAIEMIQTVYHPTDVEAAALAIVDAETAARVDHRIAELFDL
ncbi:hypothetical protein [Longimicrobium sp.]|uniref:hypothetical protein n=1 Tax=Longimicrobium sp. TaxID=2029185 RepID=UPI002E2EC7B4|nr:hypothetical protein [Longimicrobium sp.]HEX6041201.1 hypothetical protein [Longimicrobium sp.]